MTINAVAKVHALSDFVFKVSICILSQMIAETCLNNLSLNLYLQLEEEAESLPGPVPDSGRHDQVRALPRPALLVGRERLQVRGDGGDTRNQRDGGAAIQGHFTG